MYDGNPGEIDFGSSQREVRVSGDSSYRESSMYSKTEIAKEKIEFVCASRKPVAKFLS